MKRVFAGLLVLAAGCTAGLTATDTSADLQKKQVDGPLQFSVTDFVAQPGVFWARPVPVTSHGNISVAATQYGSLCRSDVSGHADVGSSAIVLTISYAERLTACTAEIRALRYDAELAVPRGSYDLTVIYDYGAAQRDTVIKQVVSVP